MDRVDELLVEGSESRLHSAVKAAMALARQTMNKYYSKTDLSEVYRLSMGMFFLITMLSTNVHTVVLHPGMKLDYF
jgi:hypothetical protein